MTCTCWHVGGVVAQHENALSLTRFEPAKFGSRRYKALGVASHGLVPREAADAHIFPETPLGRPPFGHILGDLAFVQQV